MGLLVNLKSQTLVFRFYHGETGTECTVNNLESGVLFQLGVGKTVLHPSDHLNRKVGRKLALTRALSQVDLSKEERKVVWHQYFEKHNDLKENPVVL